MPKISVSSRSKGGHRRAGKFIPDVSTLLTVTDEELARIKADGQIVCVVPDDEEVAPPLTEADRFIPSQSEYVKAGYAAENYSAFAKTREAEIRSRGGEPIFGKDEPPAPPAAPAKPVDQKAKK